MQKAFETYGEYYDIIYGDKDYDKECDFIQEIFETHSANPVSSILDAGCGTGGHSIPLFIRGYRVTGMDASSVMISRAKDKAKGLSADLAFHCADIRDFDLKQEFDACVSMFAVVDYLTEDSDLQRALRSIRSHLKVGSLFIFDFWNGLAVLRTLPSVRVKTMEGEGKKVVRTVHPELDALHHICRSHYHVLAMQGNTIVDDFSETHVVRYFFPREMAHYLDDAGFELLEFCPFLRLGERVDENEWNITAIARVNG